MIIDYEFESLGPMYGLIRQELLNLAIFTLPWAVQLRSSYDTFSPMGGFTESDIVVLTNALNQDLSDYDAPDVGLVVSHPVNNAVVPATQATCLQLPTPDDLTCSGDSGGHIRQGNSRIIRDRAYRDLFAFCRPSPPEYMRVISGTRRGTLALFFASYESSFKVPADFYTIWERTECLASLRSAPPMFGSALGEMRLPQSVVGLDLRRR
jgi:hypothetical protein